MRRRVSSRVINTGLFIDRRVRDADISNNKCRRINDIRPLNPYLSNWSNLTNYLQFQHFESEGRVIDFHA